MNYLPFFLCILSVVTTLESVRFKDLFNFMGYQSVPEQVEEDNNNDDDEEVKEVKPEHFINGGFILPQIDVNTLRTLFIEIDSDFNIVSKKQKIARMHQIMRDQLTKENAIEKEKSQWNLGFVNFYKGDLEPKPFLLIKKAPESCKTLCHLLRIYCEAQERGLSSQAREKILAYFIRETFAAIDCAVNKDTVLNHRRIMQILLNSSRLKERIPSLDKIADSRMLYLQAIDTYHQSPGLNDAIVVRIQAEQQYAKIRDGIINSFLNKS